MGTLDLSDFMESQEEHAEQPGGGLFDHLIPSSSADQEDSPGSASQPPTGGQSGSPGFGHATMAARADETKRDQGFDQTLVGTPPGLSEHGSIEPASPPQIGDIPPLRPRPLSDSEQPAGEGSSTDQTMVGTPPQFAGGDQTMAAADFSPSPIADDFNADQSIEIPLDQTLVSDTARGSRPHGSSAQGSAAPDLSAHDHWTMLAPGIQSAGSIDATVQSGHGSIPSRSEPTGSGSDSASDVKNLWEGFADSRVGPTASIKSDDMAVGRDEGLVIHRRALAPADAADADESDYKVVRYLGQGAMGVVFEAKQTSMQRGVAIKTLRPELARKGGDRQKFLYEASITGNLDHPNIVPIHDVGVNPDGTLFYSMKRVEGTPWQNVMHTKSRAENIDILLKVADAVSFAHSRNVIHRDLKPENVMLGQFGEVLVMDWGLAVNLDRGKDFVLGGTPAYMAPEMARHQVDLIDGRSDIYLLGAILFQLVVGLPPHPGETVTQCVSAAARNQIVPVESSDELLSIALRAMETNPRDRYEHVPEFQQAIRDYQDHAESIQMTQRAEEDLEHAIAHRDYPSFSRARFGFEDAVKLWPRNRRAEEGVKKSKIAHATEALTRQDFELGMSLLDENNPEETTLYNQLAKGAKERENRLKRIKAARTSAFLFMATALIVAGVGALLVNQQRLKAQSAEKLAVKNAKEAGKQRELAQSEQKRAESEKVRAEENLKIANKNAEEAEEQRKLAESEQKRAESEKERAEENLKIANEQRQRALEARTAALRSKVDATEKSVEAAQKSVDIAESNIEVLLGKLQADLTLIKTNLDDWNVQPALAGLQSIIRNSDERVSYPISFKGWETYRLLYLAQAGRPKFEIDSTAPIVDVAVSDSGERFAVAGRDGAIRVYATENRELIQTLKVPDAVSADIRAIDITSDNSQLVVGLDARNTANLYFWDLNTGQRLTNQPETGHADAVNDVYFSADGLTLLTCGREVTSRPYKTLRWWTRKSLTEPFTPYRSGDLNYAESYELDFSADGKRVLVICDKAAEILRDGTTVNRRVAALYLDEDFGENQSFSEPVVLEYRDGEVLAAVFDPADATGNQVFAATSDGLLLHWRLESLPEKAELAIDRVAANVLETKYEGHDRTKGIVSVQAVRVPGRTSDGEPLVRIATGGADGRLILWNKSEANPWKSLVGHTGLITKVGFFDGGMKVYSGCEDGRLRLWETRELVDELALEPNQPDEENLVADVLDHSFSQTKPWIAGGDQVGQITIWHSAQGDQLGSLRIGHEYGRDLITDYDPQSGRLITSSADGSTRVWDANTGRLIHVWEDTSQPEKTIGVSPSHRWLLQGINDGQREPFLRLIDLEAADGVESIKEIPFQDIVSEYFEFNNITQLGISDDGNVIAIASKFMYGYVIDRKQQLLNRQNEATTLHFLPSSTTLMTSSSGNVRVFSPENWSATAAKFDSEMINTRILGLRQLDDKLLAVFAGESSSDNDKRRQVRIYDVTDWTAREPMSSNYSETPIYGPAIIDGRVISASFDASGENLVLLVNDGQLLRWRLGDEQLKAADDLDVVVNMIRNQSRLSDSQAPPALQHLEITPSNDLILAGAGFANIWNLEQEQEKFQVPTALPIRSIRFSPTSNRLVVTHGNGQVRVWKVVESDQEGTPLRWEMETLIAGDYRLALPSPVDDKLFLLSSQGAAALYDGASGERLQTLEASDNRTVTTADWVAGEGQSTWMLLGTKGGFSSLLKLDGETISIESVLPVISTSNADISAVALSPDRRYAAIGNVDGKAMLVPIAEWQAEQTQPPGLELRDASPIESLAFNPSSSRLLVSQAQSASLWHLDELNPGLVQRLLSLDHNHTVRRALFSPDGVMVASSPQDEGRIIIWKAAPWKATQGDAFDSAWAPVGNSIGERRQDSRDALAAAEEARHVAEQELEAAEAEQTRAASELESNANGVLPVPSETGTTSSNVP